MGEHFVTNIGDHGHSLYDNLLLVPLIIHDPTRAYAARRVTSQVRTIDILPTILDLLRAPADPAVDGASLVPVMSRTDASDRPVLSGWNHKGPLRASLRDRGFKYITSTGIAAIRYPLLNPPPDHELFNLRADPGEIRNLYDAQSPLATAMDETLTNRRREFLKPDHTAPPVVDQELDERLKSLGYVQ
jgi:arylsulfatase A-like enzyme